MRVLRLPVVYPENCGVTAIAIGNGVTTPGHVTVEILAPCVVQRDGECLA